MVFVSIGQPRLRTLLRLPVQRLSAGMGAIRSASTGGGHVHIMEESRNGCKHRQTAEFIRKMLDLVADVSRVLIGGFNEHRLEDSNGDKCNTLGY